MKNHKKLFCTSLLIILGFSACKKTQDEPVNKPSKNDKAIDYILPSDLVWTNQYYPWASSNILSPFAGGTSREFPTEYISDNKLSDGWELYSNTFSSTLIDSQKKYFIIYNRFRGLMRIYYYLDNSNFSSTQNIVWELGLNGASDASNNSNILNFEQGELFDNSIKLAYTTKVQGAKKVQPNGCWYAEQFELAYDQSLSDQDYSVNVLKFGFYAQNVTNYTFEGTQTGTIDGTIQVPKPASGSFWSSVLNGSLNLGLSSIGIGGSTALKTIFSSGLGKLKIDQIDSTVLSYVATSDPIKGLPKSIFNAILGKNSGGTGYSTEKVNLKMNTSIKLQGTSIGSPTGLGTVNTLLSGTQNLYSDDSGIIPLFTKRLGVFNIVGVPSIVRSSSHENLETKTITTATYDLDLNSFSIIWNPDVINTTPTGASIQNIKKEMILIKVTAPVNANEQFYSNEYITDNGEISKAVINNASISYSRPFLTNAPVHWAPNIGGYGVRISFDVVPNDQSPKITIIKTVKAVETVIPDDL
ncbi:hypothetical protein SAMN06265348_108284 [Pedobacter westerhofensis]|uniref:Uncharacterized protein n=1 Tax=Pedobacter westerhofensis TaxID=425512 RepID=A0A521EMB9_9SPHI|nr:hypothetical protein [Pedobacter westerhofensis]SMO85069.1 hypothetical protein SAMN06265348_108284 [Pedobacter westerhofensis]